LPFKNEFEFGFDRMMKIVRIQVIPFLSRVGMIVVAIYVEKLPVSRGA